MAMINLPRPFKAREVIIGIVGFNKNPCLKFELMGCEDEPEERKHLGKRRGSFIKERIIKGFYYEVEPLLSVVVRSVCSTCYNLSTKRNNGIWPK